MTAASPVSVPPAAVPLLSLTLGDLIALLQSNPALANRPLASLAPAPAVTLGAAIDELLAAKVKANLRPAYVTSLRLYLRAFAKGREATPVQAIAAADLEAWFDARKEKPASRRSNLGRLASLFAYCQRRGYLSDNPCRRIEPTRIDAKPPRILSIEESRKLLAACRRRAARFMPCLALGLFTGIRPEELARLDWSAVDLQRGRVRIDATVSKVRRMRFVTLPPVCIAWLNWHLEHRGLVAPSPNTRRRCMRKLRTAMQWERWPQDVLRHTAASYLIAREQDAGRVALQLGNSPAILLRHYRELVSPEDAELFWKLCPETVPAPAAVPVRKYDRAAVRAFHDQCRSYKLTMAHFGMGSTATLHYVLSQTKPAADAPAAPVAEPLREAA